MRIKQVKRSYISSFKATVSLVSGVIYSDLCRKTSAGFKEASFERSITSFSSDGVQSASSRPVIFGDSSVYY